MKTRKLSVAGHAVEIAEAGNGPALLYLHGFADVHGASSSFLPFHEALAKSFRVVAPAHPCCAGSDEDDDIETMDDLAFRYAETMDALGLDKVAIAGACVGGWIAAERMLASKDIANTDLVRVLINVATVVFGARKASAKAPARCCAKATRSEKSRLVQ